MMKRFFTGSVVAAFLLLAVPGAAMAALGVTSVTPNSIQQGSSAPVTITGTDFPGSPSVSFGSGITVSNIGNPNSSTITATVSVSGTAGIGPRTITVAGSNFTGKFSVAPTSGGSGTSGIPEDFAPPAPGTTPTTAEGLIGVIQTITSWIFGILLAVSVIFLVWAAFEFVTGGPDGAKSGQQKLMYAAIGIALALVAFGLPQIIKSIVVQ